MGCVKVLVIGTGVMFGGMMVLQAMGEMGRQSATNAPRQTVAPPADPPAVKRSDVSTPSAANAPGTDKETADMLAINIILNGYGCYRVRNWRGDGFGGKNIVTCVERKGRSKVVQYEVEPLEGSAVML